MFLAEVGSAAHCFADYPSLRKAFGHIHLNRMKQSVFKKAKRLVWQAAYRYAAELSVLVMETDTFSRHICKAFIACLITLSAKSKHTKYVFGNGCNTRKAVRCFRRQYEKCLSQEFDVRQARPFSIRIRSFLCEFGHVKKAYVSIRLLH